MAEFDRNQWPVCVGISGRFRSEYASYIGNGQPFLSFRRSYDMKSDDIEALLNGKENQVDGLLDEVDGVYDSIDGNRLSGLMNHRPFFAWLEDVYDFDLDVYSPKRLGVSWWLTGCTLVKCTFGGGPANPICATCTVVSIGMWSIAGLTHLVGAGGNMPSWW